MDSPQLTIDATRIAIADWRELANRGNDGLTVSLLWSSSTDRVTVTVVDDRLDEKFELDIARAEALDAFYHPFAYAPTPSLGALDQSYLQQRV
jgi:hypothetical protein